MDVSITIVNYNQKELLKKCLDSIIKNIENLVYEIIVVDNASNDGSIEMLYEYQDKVKILKNEKNLFFTRAYNMAIKESKGRYICILNNDAEIVNNAFLKIIRFMDKNKDIAICGPQLINGDGSIQVTCDRLPTLTYAIFELTGINYFFPDNPSKRRRTYYGWDRKSYREVDSVSGACMIVKREVIEKTGMFDENYLMYWEEVDLCKRIKNVGYKIVYFPESKVIHYSGQTTKNMKKDEVNKIFQDSMLYYYRKNIGIFAYIILFIIRIKMNLIKKMSYLTGLKND